MKHIAVIGAGLAGIGAARRLRRDGFQVTVFERASYVGGRIHTHRGEGFSVNTGAGFFTNFYPLLSELIEELGLNPHITEHPKVIALADGQQSYTYHLNSVVSFFRIPFLTLGDKFRLLRLTISLMLRKKRLNLVNPHQLAAFDDESIAVFSRRKVGERAYQYLVRTGIEPYWYFSSESVSAAMMMALQASAATARFFTLTGGIDQIATHALEGYSLHLGTEITTITQNPEGGVTLHLPEGETQNFDGVVLATTASVAQRLTAEVELPALVREFIESQQYAANLNAYFFLPEEYMKDIPLQISGCGPNTKALAAIARHGSEVAPSQHPGEGILGIWLLDQASREALSQEEEAVTKMVWDLARQYHPALPEQPSGCAQLTRREEAIPLHAPGRYKMASKAWKAQKPPIVVAGDYLTTATMEGALQAGYWAAEIFTKHLKP